MTRRFAFLAALVLLLATHAQAGSVTVAWDPNPEPNVRYIVWWGTSHLNYTSSAAAGPATSFVVSNLTSGKTYFFAVQAQDPTTGATSPMSEEVFATISSTGSTDSKGPTLAVASHSNGQTVTSSQITLTGTASDAGMGDNGISQLTVNGTRATGDVATGTGVARWSYSFSLRNGANTVVVASQDGSAAHNASSTSLTINCDCGVKLKSFTTSAQFPLELGAPATFTASAEGGTPPLEYMFWVRSAKTGSWTVLQDYQPKAELSWIPTQMDTYNMQVWVRSAGSTATYDAWGPYGPFAAGQELRITGFSASTSLLAAGTPVTITATASGGMNPRQFKFWAQNRDTGQWTVLQEYAPGNTVTWTPSTAGSYAMQVWVRSANSSAAYDTWQALAGGLRVTPASESAVEVRSLTSNVGSPVSVGTPVTWTAVAGGSGTLEYQFWLRNVDAGTWSVLQPYSTSPTAVWRPTAAGTYSLQVWVRRVGSSVAWQAWRPSEPFLVTPGSSNPVRITGITADRAFPVAAGTSVTLSASASGGTPPLLYMFWLFNVAKAQWTVLQDYAANSRVAWVPTEPGEYRLQVWVRSSGSTAAYDTWQAYGPMTVSAPGINVASLTPSSLVVDRDTPMTLSAAASGTGAPLEYQFWLRDATAGTWTVIQDYSAAASVQWVPGKSGQYSAQVWVRTQGSAAAYEAWKASPTFTVR